MIDPIYDLVVNGPWPVQALCTECGLEHTTLTLTRNALERLGEKLTPRGICPPCSIEEEAALKKMTADRRDKQEAMPSKDDAYDMYGKDTSEVDDLFGDKF